MLRYASVVRGVRRCQGSRLRVLVAAVIVLFTGACGSGGNDGNASSRYAVLSAFPAEGAPVVEQADVDEMVTIEGHVFRVGTLGGVPVVMALTGIGLVNAANTTRLLLDHFDVKGIIVSAVAGSFLRIGDVAVPSVWILSDGTIYNPDQGWLGIAGELTPPGAVVMEQCTVPPSMPSVGSVCLTQDPVIVVGGVGYSSDPFSGNPFPCQPEGSDVFGCDVGAKGSTPAWMKGGVPEGEKDDAPDADEPELQEPGGPVVGDMETAAVAREAAVRGVPLIAFRAASDGKGDPLGLKRPFAQFFIYYRLAGRNAAASTEAFLQQLAASHSCGT